jgi:hypothetical protein
METVLEEYITEEQRSVMLFFLWEKDSMQRIIMKNFILFTVGSVCRVKRFITGPLENHLGGKRIADDKEVETEVRKWLRTVRRLLCCGFDALVKRWDKCINVAGGYVEKQMFFPGSNITRFTFYIHL